MPGSLLALVPELLEPYERAAVRLNQLDREAIVAALAAARGRRSAADDPGRNDDEPILPLRVVDGVALIPIVGQLMSTPPWWAGLFGPRNPTIGEIGAAVDRAAADPDVTSILLRVASPGGEVPTSIADSVWAARQRKHVAAYIVYGGSAAYWIATQAHQVAVERGALVGSIGGFSWLVDSSKAAEEAGYRVIAVRSTPLKGAGLPGTEVTDEMVAERQREIDDLCSLFVSDVARGLGISLERAEELHDARLYVGMRAVEMGLAHRVTTEQQLFNELVAAGRGRRVQADRQKRLAAAAV